MRRVLILITVAVMLSVGAAAAAEMGSLGERAAAIERASKAADGDRVVVGHLSRTLGISVDALRTQRSQTGLGWGDLLIANRLSRESRVSVDEVVAEFRSGKRWEDIALDHNVNVLRLVAEMQRSQELVEQRTEDRVPPANLGTRYGEPRPPASGGSTRMPGAGSGHGGH